MTSTERRSGQKNPDWTEREVDMFQCDTEKVLRSQSAGHHREDQEAFYLLLSVGVLD